MDERFTTDIATASQSQESIISSDSEDNEPPEGPVPGWPRVAELMAQTQDFAAFKRYRDLNVKSLLYYQAEIEMLREKLHEEEWADSQRGDDKQRLYARRIDYMIRSRDKSTGTQWKIVIELRKVLKEYNKALLLYSQISALSEPEQHNMQTLRRWLKNENDGGRKIGGNGEHLAWGDTYEQESNGSIVSQFRRVVWHLLWSGPPPPDGLDLVSPLPPKNVDGFSRWVATYWIPFWNEVWTFRKQRRERERLSKDLEMEQVKKGVATVAKAEPDVKSEFKETTLATYSEKGILRFTSSVSTVVACLLPVIAITVLSEVHGQRNLLLCLAGFAVIFAIGLISLGTGSRIEIFGATAA
ncbi:hypothetical protein BDZ45DRAFT_600874 [Acephala macrosclerotiorum]|nr:hypothetical protein BDZ45DRAFT_600874 [Acephala macrosclerotiorum]